MSVEQERLDKFQADLVASGYEDVKFFFERSNKSLSQAATEAADVLEAILKHRSSPFESFADTAG